MSKLKLFFASNAYLTFGFIFVLLNIFHINVKAQSSVIIGTGTSNTNGNNPDPLERFWHYTHFQIVYLATELNAGGLMPGAQITALGFSVSESAVSLANFSISMGHTTQILANPYIAGGLTQVKSSFSYAPLVQSAGNFDMITFDTPFTWDGISNIVVNTCTGSNTFASPYGGVRYTAGVSGVARFIRNDATSNCLVATNTNTPNRPNIKFNYANTAICNGVPNPGNTTGPASVCAGVNFNLGLQYLTQGSGITYQWESADDAAFTINVFNLGTANSQITSQTTHKFYRCLITCNSVALSNYSLPISVTINPFVNCYCTSQATFTADEDIFNVTINGASTNPLYSNTNACTVVAPGVGSAINRYSNFKPLGSLTHFAAGASIPFTIVENECDGPQYFAFGTSVWIDYNQNGSFTDVGEQVFVEANTLAGPRNISGSFTVPLTAIPGCTVMRITVAESTSGSALTPCLNYDYGETEDYLICIDSSCQGTPNVGIITPLYNQPCDSNGTISLSASGNVNVTGINYQWETANTPTGPWVSIAGSTTQTYVVPSPSIPNYYNCVQTCATSTLATNANPIVLQPYPPVSIELDTIYCNGFNSQLQQMFHYSLHINNATFNNATIASITSSDGSILNFSTSTLIPGLNMVGGDLLIGQSALTKYGIFSFKILIVHYPSNDTCCKVVYVSIPNCAVNVCDSNLLQNGTFSLGIFPGSMLGDGNVNDWSLANGNPIVENMPGCDEMGYIKLIGNKITGSAIKQTLLPANKIIKNQWYKVSMCVRLDSFLIANPSFKLRVMAFNGSLPTGFHPPPSSNATIIGFTGLIRSKEWTTIELDSWYAYKDFDHIAINIFNNDTLISSIGYLDGVCLRQVSDSCDCDGLDRDSLGNVIFPPELFGLIDTTEQTIDSVEMLMGSLDDIYGDWNTDLDTFYSGTPDLCCKSIGGTIPQAGEDFNPEDSLAALGIPISMDSIRHLLSDYGTSLADSMLTNFPNFEDKFSELSLIPGIQIDSLCFCDSTTSNIPLDPLSPFQGMDIIFVHGLHTGSIQKKIFDYSSFQYLTKWPEDKKEFYHDYKSFIYYGGWKKYADEYWEAHINEYLKPSGTSYNNRYLTIAWPSTQRIPYDAHAMLSQIYEAMSNGEGVELINPNDPRKKDEFGKNGFVIISHSTGGLLTNVAMAVAEQTRTNIPLRLIYGPAYRISDKAKLHIAMHTALAGSHIATVGLALLDQPVLLGLANIIFEGGLPSIPSVIDYALTAKRSILVDLCPPVTQLVWMYPISLLNLNPVPTLTIAGGDPGSANPANTLLTKSLLLPGFDDGVLTLECQTGNPLPASLPNVPVPSIYALGYGLNSAPGVYFPTSKLKAVDMGIKPYRLTSYYIAQFKEEHSILGAAASGCTPFVSPTGMVQPFLLNSFTRNSLLRYTNHYSFLQSPSYHNSGPKGKIELGNTPYISNLYTPSYGETNFEEESVITNNTVYATGLVSPSFHGLMERTVKGPRKTIKFRIPFCKKCKTYTKTFWLWQRNYDRLKGHETLLECDYIYQYVLKP